MDLTGWGKRNAFPVDRTLTEEERRLRYDLQKQPSHLQPMDFLSVIKFNGSYIDLVDRWYPIRGFNAWLAIAVTVVTIGLICAPVVGIVLGMQKGHPPPTWFYFFIPILMGAFGWAMYYGLSYAYRFEFLSWTHYPMRLNRKTRMVYVFRQNGTVLAVPWGKLFITRGEAKAFMTGTTYDLRAHVLDDDGVTVRESFSLGYSYFGSDDSPDKFWAFLQPYMEAPDGVERTYRLLKGGDMLPLDRRKEGWRWSIARTFATAGPWPWLQLLISPMFALNSLGRILAMWTSKQPSWPEEVEQANPIEPGDPYVLTWRDNPPLGWWELYWPMICLFVGITATVAVLWWVFSQL